MERGRLRGHHGADGLPPGLDRVPERGVHVRDHALVGLRSAPCVAEDSLVVLLRGVRDVEAFSEGTGVLPVASVADVGGVAEVGTGPLPEVLAHLEAPPLTLERGLLSGGGAVDLRTCVEMLADRVRASVALVAPDHPVLDLVGDRGFGAVEHPGHFRERKPAAEAVGDSFPCAQCHVLCHGDFSFRLIPCTGPDHPALREWAGVV